MLVTLFTAATLALSPAPVPKPEDAKKPPREFVHEIEFDGKPGTNPTSPELNTVKATGKLRLPKDAKVESVELGRITIYGPEQGVGVGVEVIPAKVTKTDQGYDWVAVGKVPNSSEQWFMARVRYTVVQNGMTVTKHNNTLDVRITSIQTKDPE